MKLSFVIPAFNEEHYLGECLDSIIRETVDKKYDIEIIVVNNASTDRTKSVALSRPGVKVVDEPQKGLVRARRAGFLASTGDLIANIDSDTRLTPHWIETVFQEFSKSPKLVALSGPFIYYDFSPARNMMVKFFYILGYFGYLINRFVLRMGSLLQGGNFIIKRSALEQIGGYDLNIDFYGEDSDIARRMHKVGDVKFTFKLPIYSSGRRLAGEGFLKMGIRYGLNYVWIMFFKKPFTKDYIDVRKKTTDK